MISKSRKEGALPTPEREEHSLVSFLGHGITVTCSVQHKRGRGKGWGAGCLQQRSWRDPGAALPTQTHTSWKPGPLLAACQSGNTRESFRANSSRGPHPLLYPPSIASCFLSLCPGYKLHMTTEASLVTSRWAVGHKPLERGWAPRNA